ncbi:MAG: hypothetical protein QM731_25930 [Chitinophagaceae bacterium]
MAWISMYLLDKDVELLNHWLNQEEEIAFLVSNGHKEWIAQKEHSIIADIGKQNFGNKHNFAMPHYAEYNLWHVPSGPLPLLAANKDDKIDNPWLGWTENITGRNARLPYFGAGHPGVIHLEIKLPHDNEIRISGFGWIGNHYKMAGNAAAPLTEQFWNKLRRALKKFGPQIPRCNNLNGRKEVFAFPAAYEAIKKGRPCALN